MPKKQLNEGIITRFIDRIIDSMKRQELERVKSKIQKDPELKAIVSKIDQNYKDLLKYLEDRYGKNYAKKWDAQRPQRLAKYDDIEYVKSLGKSKEE